MGNCPWSSFGQVASESGPGWKRNFLNPAGAPGISQPFSPSGQGVNRREDAPERNEYPRDRLGGEALGAQGGDQAGAVVGRDLAEADRTLDQTTRSAERNGVGRRRAA